MVKELKVTVRERLLLMQFFPQKGSQRDMRIARDIARKAALTAEEKAEIEFRTEGQTVVWSADKAKELALELNDDEREFLKRQVGRLDEEEAYTQDLLALAERITEL